MYTFPNSSAGNVATDLNTLAATTNPTNPTNAPATTVATTLLNSRPNSIKPPLAEMEDLMRRYRRLNKYEQRDMFVELPPALPMMVESLNAWAFKINKTTFPEDLVRTLLVRAKEIHKVFPFSETVSRNSVSNLFYGHVGKFVQDPSPEEIDREESWIREYAQAVDTDTSYFCTTDELIDRWRYLRRVASTFYLFDVRPIFRPLNASGTEKTICLGLALPQRLMRSILLNPKSDYYRLDSTGKHAMQSLSNEVSQDHPVCWLHCRLINHFTPDWTKDPETGNYLQTNWKGLSFVLDVDGSVSLKERTERGSSQINDFSSSSESSASNTPHEHNPLPNSFPNNTTAQSTKDNLSDIVQNPRQSVKRKRSQDQLDSEPNKMVTPPNHFPYKWTPADETAPEIILTCPSWSQNSCAYDCIFVLLQHVKQQFPKVWSEFRNDTENLSKLCAAIELSSFNIRGYSPNDARDEWRKYMLPKLGAKMGERISLVNLVDELNPKWMTQHVISKKLYSTICEKPQYGDLRLETYISPENPVPKMVALCPSHSRPFHLRPFIRIVSPDEKVSWSYVLVSGIYFLEKTQHFVTRLFTIVQKKHRVLFYDGLTNNEVEEEIGDLNEEALQSVDVDGKSGSLSMAFYLMIHQQHHGPKSTSNPNDQQKGSAPQKLKVNPTPTLPQKVQEPSVLQTVDKAYPCSKCKKSFKTLEESRVHMQTHRVTFNCFFCADKMFRRRTVLITHLEKVHPNLRHLDDLECNACKKVMPDFEAFKIHCCPREMNPKS